MNCIVPIEKSSTGYKGCFKASPSRIGYMNVKGYQDALKYWEMLKSAKYLDAHTDNYTNRMIRQENYSFLDKLTGYTDKSEFIRKFCEFTGFPNLRDISNKIERTFKECINRIANSEYGAFDIVDSGYDPTCSVSLKKAFPGSDLDKGYVIIKGESSYTNDTELVNQFKGKLWEQLDNRIVSQNHPETSIDVYTKKQVKEKLDDVASTVSLIRYKPGFKTYLSCLLGPIVAGVGYMTDVTLRNSNFYNLKHSTQTDPYEAALFNRTLAKYLPSGKKEMFKNFAFFIETVAANLERDSYGKYDSLFSEIKESPFVQYSNVTQIEAWQNRINNGYLKSKLRNREELEWDFDRMSLETKYDLVKDVIKSASNDQSTKFSKYFKNDDDIKERYTRLLNSLR